MSVKAGIAFLLILVKSFSAQAVNVLVEHTIFYIPGEGKVAPYIDIYWEVDAQTLNFTKGENGWSSAVEVAITISTDTGKLREERFTLQTPGVADKEMATKQVILDLRRFLLPYGKIKLDVIFTEASGKPYTYTDTFTIAEPEMPFASGLQLLDTSYRSDVASIFQRNGMQHIPLSFAFIDDYRHALNYYFELYGLDKFKNDEPLILKTFISKKANENILSSYIRTDTLRSDAVVPRYGSYDVSGLPSGNYYLNASVFSHSGKRLAFTSRYFQRANKKPATEAPIADTVEKPDILDTTSANVVVFNINKTFVSKYNPAQVKAILKMLLPLASAGEKQNINAFIKTPDELYMRYFIYNFWLNRDPEKPEKEWEKYADRVREVNRLFGSDHKPGYETDRGYIYLKYGKPTERIIVTNEQSALPYEVWQYFQVSTQGKDGLFLFYKPGNEVADYRLLHSTVTGEAKDLNWRNSLYPNGKTGMMDSQAEVHLRNR